jgi:hypothetical protein
MSIFGEEMNPYEKDCNHNILLTRSKSIIIAPGMEYVFMQCVKCAKSWQHIEENKK